MCILFCMSHAGSSRENFIGGYHCSHLGCPGTLEAHHKFLLEEDQQDCSICLGKDRVEVDPDVVPVKYYPPVEDIEIEYAGPVGYRNVKKSSQGHNEAETAVQEEKEDSVDLADWRSQQDFSDVDSVTSHWRLDHPTQANEAPAEAIKSPSSLKGSATPFSPQETPEKTTPNTAKHRELVNEQLAKLPYYQVQPHSHHPRRPGQPTFSITRPPAHAFPARGPPVPPWPFHPHNQNPQPTLPGPHSLLHQSMINCIPHRDYMLWHPVSHPDAEDTERKAD
jgi:hypothetical protein